MLTLTCSSDTDFNSQREVNALAEAFRRSLNYLGSANQWSSPFMGLNPFQNRRIKRNGDLIEKLVGEELDKKYSRSMDEEKGKRTMCDLALDTYNAEMGQTSKGMDTAFRKLAIDQ